MATELISVAVWTAAAFTAGYAVRSEREKARRR